MPDSLLGTKLIIPFRWPGIITQLGYLILVKILNVTWKDASMIIHWKSKFLSDVWLLETPWTIQSMEFSRPEYPSILQGIFPTQGSNPGLPHCRWIPYQLIHQGSWRILEWEAYPFSSGSSQPRNRTRVSRTAGVFLSAELDYSLEKHKSKQ